MKKTAKKKKKKASYRFQLFVTGANLRSSKAIGNIKQICEEYLRGDYRLEVIDIYRKPQRARDEQIVAAPTLIKRLPLPLRRFVGDLSDRDHVLLGLELK